MHLTLVVISMYIPSCSYPLFCIFREFHPSPIQITLNVQWGFNAQMIPPQRNAARIHAYIGKSTLCRMLKRCPLHFGYFTKAHSCSAACLLSSHTVKPTHTTAFCWVPCMLFFFLCFLKGLVVRKVQEGNQRFQRGEERQCSIPIRMLLGWIVSVASAVCEKKVVLTC